MSQKQLDRLRKVSSKHLKAPSVANKEDDEDNVATVNASTSSNASTTETGSTETTTTVKEPVTTEEESLLPTPSSASTTVTVSTETTTVLKEPVTTEEESPIRHRLTNLLDGSSLSPYEDSAAHINEENVESFNCRGGGQLYNAESVSRPVPTEESLFCSSKLFSSDNGLSPLMYKEDGITVPCYPDVVSKTCMQVEMRCTQTWSDDDTQAADVITASVHDKEVDHETNQRLNPSSLEDVSSALEEGNEQGSVSPGSCDILGQLSNNTVADEKEAGNGNAEEDCDVMSRSAEVHAEDSRIDYSSHYNTLEVCGTSLPLKQCGVLVNGIL